MHGAMKLGVVSDIHCQHEALIRAIELMGPVDRLICAGDAIDQSRFCNRTIGLLREHGFHAIRGNHEFHFFAEASARQDSMEAELGDWLRSRPDELRFAAAGADIHVVHATAWDGGYEYVVPTHRAFARFAESGADIVIYGHTHQPVVRRIGDTLIVNPGSVGEGRPDARGFIRSCAVIDCAARDARIIDLD